MNRTFHLNGREYLAGIKVDEWAIIEALGKRAAKSKTGRATALGGAIVVDVKAKEQQA